MLISGSARRPELGRAIRICLLTWRTPALPSPQNVTAAAAAAADRRETERRRERQSSETINSARWHGTPVSIDFHCSHSIQIRAACKVSKSHKSIEEFYRLKSFPIESNIADGPEGWAEKAGSVGHRTMRREQLMPLMLIVNGCPSSR